MGWVIGLLAFVLFVFSVLAIVMIDGDYAAEVLEMPGDEPHGALLDAAQAEKTRLMADAMKADRA